MKLKINNLCSQDFASMSRNDIGGFCHHCQKNVIDFTKYSNAELTDYFRNAENNVCGRLHVFQLDKLSEPVLMKRTWKNRIAALAAFGLAILTFQKASANPIKQTSAYHPIAGDKKQASSLKSSVSDSTKVNISGQVVDEDDGLPILGALVRLKGANKVFTTDTAGRFNIEATVEASEKLSITINYIGFERKEVEITNTNEAQIIKLKLAPVMMGAVVVVERKYENPFQRLYYKAKRLIRRIF